MSKNHSIYGKGRRMSDPYNTIIIGCGAAGVTAANALASNGALVLVLEAMDRVGGRVHTVPLGEGVVELGAEWVHGSSPSIVYSTAIHNDIVLLPQNLPLHVYFSDGMKRSPEKQQLFSELVDQVFLIAGQPSDKPEPLGDYCQRKFMEYLRAEKPELVHKRELISQVLQYSQELINNYNATNDWNDNNAQGKYEEIEGHQHFSWSSVGYSRFFDLMLSSQKGQKRDFLNLEVKLNSEVVSIEWPQDPQWPVEVTCADGTVYFSENVIVTVSLGVLKERHQKLFKPPLPAYKVRAIDTIAMGVIDKMELSFETVWWPLNEGVFFGFIWRDEERRKIPAQDWWITKVFAASRTMSARNVLTLWTSGDSAKLMESLPLVDVKIKCRQILQRFMGCTDNFSVPCPIDIKRSTWYSNPFTRGSYSYDSMAAAQYPDIRQDLASPLLDAGGNPRVLFAGEAAHDKHYSTVHGACETGYREAMRLINSARKFESSKL